MRIRNGVELFAGAEIPGDGAGGARLTFLDRPTSVVRCLDTGVAQCLIAGTCALVDLNSCFYHFAVLVDCDAHIDCHRLVEADRC